MGIGWASGINLYAAICMLGILDSTGQLALAPDLLMLQDPGPRDGIQKDRPPLQKVGSGEADVIAVGVDS